MLWFNHPRPLSRKEVAMQMVARSTETLPTISLLSQHRSSEPVSTLQAPAGSSSTFPISAIQLTMSYTLSEYLDILSEHAVSVVKRKQRIRGGRFSGGVFLRMQMLPLWAITTAVAFAYLSGFAYTALLFLVCGVLVVISELPFSLRLWAVLLGAPLFFFKLRGLSTCNVTIGETGIVFSSAGGSFLRTWQEVAFLRSHSSGYLLQFKSRALPIPYRFLDSEQRAGLRQLFARHVDVGKV